MKAHATRIHIAQVFHALKDPSLVTQNTPLGGVLCPMHFMLRDVLATAGRPQKVKGWQMEELVRSWDPRTFADRYDRMPIEDQGIPIEYFGILVSLAGFVWLAKPLCYVRKDMVQDRLVNKDRLRICMMSKQ